MPHMSATSPQVDQPAAIANAMTNFNKTAVTKLRQKPQWCLNVGRGLNRRGEVNDVTLHRKHLAKMFHVKHFRRNFAVKSRSDASPEGFPKALQFARCARSHPGPS
jgi:hypothetical protein